MKGNFADDRNFKVRVFITLMQGDFFIKNYSVYNYYLRNILLDNTCQSVANPTHSKPLREREASVPIHIKDFGNQHKSDVDRIPFFQNRPSCYQTKPHHFAIRLFNNSPLTKTGDLRVFITRHNMPMWPNIAWKVDQMLHFVETEISEAKSIFSIFFSYSRNKGLNISTDLKILFQANPYLLLPFTLLPSGTYSVYMVFHSLPIYTSNVFSCRLLLNVSISRT
jgi:hypothetical protein